MTTRFIDHLLTGDHASRPVASAVPQGTLYSCTTHGLLYQSDGVSVWSTYATLGGGAPASHAASHENGGGDEIDVTGLSGLLADPQTPDAHTHAESDITGLVADLAAKADATDLATEASDRASADTALDSRIDALESATTPPEAQGTWLASGGAVVFLQNYDFRVSAATYYINGTQYTAAQTDITLAAADATFDRFDAIAVTTSGTVVAVTGTPASNPALPDIDPETQLALTYVLVQAASSAATITQTNIYLENTEWTSSVSGGTINAASTSNPFAGTKDIEATASAAGHYVRLTNGAPVSLADKKQLVINIRSKASWPNPKSLQITWYLSGAKIGQSAALSSGKFGFVSATTGAYQQIVIPISAFAVPSSSTVDRLEFLVSGSGGTIGFYLDNIVLESGSADVTPPSVGAATASTLGLVRTDVTDASPVVYLKASVDTALALKADASTTTSALALKAPLASPALTGTPTAPTASGGTNTTQVATTAFVTSAVAAATTGVSSVFGRTGAVVKAGGDYAVADVTGAAPLASPTFTGTVTVPTQSASDNSTKAASTAYVDAAVTLAAGTYTDEKAQDAVGAMVDASLTYVDATPLLQRAALTGDVTASAGSNATTIKNDVALGGNPTTTTQSPGNNTTRIATTAFVSAAITAGGTLPDWVSGNPRTPSAVSSPSAFDDEFESSSLDVKWTRSVTASPTDDIDTTWPSHYYVHGTGSTDEVKLTQTYAPGAVAFSMSLGAVLGASEGFAFVGMEILDAAGNNGFQFVLGYASTVTNTRLHTKTSGSYSFDTYNQSNGDEDEIILHVERDSGSAWSFWTSKNGRGFRRLSTQTKSFTVGKVNLLFGMNTSVAPTRMGADFFRVNWPAVAL